MTTALAERVLELAEKATPGPWRAYCRDVGNPENDPSWSKDFFLQFEIAGPEAPTGRGDFFGYDAAFIALCRTAAPALARHLLAAHKALKSVANLGNTFLADVPWQSADYGKGFVDGSRKAFVQTSSMARAVLAEIDRPAEQQSDPT